MTASRSVRASVLILSTALLGACARAPQFDSAVLVVVDTLRADHLGLYGYGRETSPNLDRWSQEAAVFETAVATSPWTLPTFGSLLTGELPSRHRAGFHETVGGLKEFTALDVEVPTLAEILQGSGLSTGAVVNNPFLHPRFGIARGFDTYDYVPGSNLEVRRADAVVDAALRWLDGNAERPYFLLVHFFDPHLNYDPPPPFRGQFTGDPDADGYRYVRLAQTRRMLRTEEPVDMEFLEAAYDEEIAFVDSQIDRLLVQMQSRGLTERTLVMLTADHGEEFLDHGGFEHGHSMYQELLRVPLLVWGPGVVPRSIAEPVSLVDLPATVLQGLGDERYRDLPGRSLLPALGGETPPTERTLVAEAPKYGRERRSLIQWPLKLIHGQGTATRLFDLVGDTDERTNLADDRRDDVARMQQALESFRLANAPGDFDAVDLDPEMLRQLRSLGYVR